MANWPKVDTAALQDELVAAKEEAAQLHGTAVEQEELKELRSLNRRLQCQFPQSEVGKFIQTYFGHYAAYSFTPSSK